MILFETSSGKIHRLPLVSTWAATRNGLIGLGSNTEINQTLNWMADVGKCLARPCSNIKGSADCDCVFVGVHSIGGVVSPFPANRVASREYAHCCIKLVAGTVELGLKVVPFCPEYAMPHRESGLQRNSFDAEKIMLKPSASSEVSTAKMNVMFVLPDSTGTTKHPPLGMNVVPSKLVTVRKSFVSHRRSAIAIPGVRRENAICDAVVTGVGRR